MNLKQLSVRAVKYARKELRAAAWSLQGRFRETVTVSTLQGRLTVSTTDQFISRSLYCFRQYELDFMRDSLAFLRSRGYCATRGTGALIDVGANNGVIAVGALYTGEFSHAIAVEPDPGNFALLERNARQNDFAERLYCLPFAAAAEPGELRFELSDTNFGDHRVHAATDGNGMPSERFGESARRTITVKADRLDQLLRGLPADVRSSASLLWVDVQGFEGFVFQGADELLRRGIPVVTELWPYGILRAGMSQASFCAIAEQYWTHYWVQRRRKFVSYPINLLGTFFEELGNDGDFENVIFVNH